MITPANAFSNLFEVIEYYKNSPLKCPAWEIVLGEPCPQPPDYLGEKWYRAKVDRAEAESMLKRVRTDGAFLVRPSSEDSGMSISFRAEGKIKHCRIVKQDRLYIVGDAEFDSLKELITFYTRFPLYATNPPTPIHYVVMGLTQKHD